MAHIVSPRATTESPRAGAGRREGAIELADRAAELRSQLEAETRNDILAQFAAALRRDYPVEVDGAVINRLIDPDDLGGYGLTG